MVERLPVALRILQLPREIVDEKRGKLRET